MSASVPARSPSGFLSGLRPSPPLIVGAFALLLVTVFAVAYAVGSGAGPVNPRMRPAPTGVPANGHGGMGGMSGMSGTGGMG